MLRALGAGWLLLGTRPAGATPGAMADAIAKFTGGAVPRAGRVRLEIAELVENGNVVPATVSVDSAMAGTDRVTAIAVFSERNPQPEVAVFELGPRSARARVAFRMRMAESQRIVAVARFADGSFWTGSASVLVTLAACLE